MVKFYSLAQFPVNQLSHPIMPTLLFLLYKDITLPASNGNNEYLTIPNVPELRPHYWMQSYIIQKTLLLREYLTTLLKMQPVY